VTRLAFCECHIDQQSPGIRDFRVFRVEVIDKGGEVLKSKHVALEVGFIVPVPVEPR
jgi:hypothetical protein